MMKFRKTYFLILLFNLIFLVSWSQEDPENIMISPTGDSIIIKAIPDAEITDNIEKAIESIKKIEGKLEPDKDLKKFDSIYAKSHIRLDSLKEIILYQKEFYSIRDIDDALQEWKSYSEELNSWKQAISDRIKSLSGDYFEVDVLNSTWATTLEKSIKSGVPTAVLTNVKEISQTLNVFLKKIRDAQNLALTKQNKITEVRLTVDEVITFLNETRKNVQADYFLQDSPPLWRAGDSTSNKSQFTSRWNKTKEETSKNLDLFYKSNRSQLIIQLLLFLALWFGFYLLHKQSINEDELDDKLNLDSARGVISSHALSALIIVLFTSIWFYTTIVTTVSDILQLLYIILALLFLPRVIDKRLSIVLLALLGLFFTNNFQLILPGKLLLSRLVLLIECILAGWILYKFISPKFFIAEALKKNNWGFILKLIPIFFFFLIISVFANILGYVNLSLLLSNTTVNGLFNLNILILVIMVTKHTLAVFLRTPFAQSSNIIRKGYLKIEKRLLLIIQIVGIYIWFRSVLRLLGLFDELSYWFTEEFLKANWKIGNSTILVETIVIFFLVILGTYIIYRIVKELLSDELYPRIKLPRGVPGAISMVTGYFIVGYGVFIAFGVITDLSNFGLAAGALGVGIGFGLQGIVANFIAGLVLAFERPIQVGDTIEVGTLMGDVTQIGVRASRIRTFDGSEVIIPNSSLITNDVINWTLSDRRKRRDINISVAYGSDPEEVMALIRKVAESHPDVLKIPAPWALFDGFGDSALLFRIRIWTTMDNGMTTKSSVAVEIYKALNEAGIEVPFPQRDLHLKTVDPLLKDTLTEKPKTVRRRATTKKKPDKDSSGQQSE